MVNARKVMATAKDPVRQIGEPRKVVAVAPDRQFRPLGSGGTVHLPHHCQESCFRPGWN